METNQDRELMKIAKRRVGFKRHLASYLIINSLLWFLWYMAQSKEEKQDFPWPVWPMLGWGIGLAFDFLGTYVYTKGDAIQREYNKLKEKG